MMSRSSKSTLFPYTTLFRSLSAQELDDLRCRRARREHGRDALALQLLRVLGGNRPDRKSTRLNSSHANISYAVFCLKKKSVYVCSFRIVVVFQDANYGDVFQ